MQNLTAMFENIHTDFTDNLEEMLAKMEATTIEDNKDAANQAPFLNFKTDEGDHWCNLLEYTLMAKESGFRSGAGAQMVIENRYIRECVNFIECAVGEFLTNEGFSNIEGYQELVGQMHKELNERIKNKTKS